MRWRQTFVGIETNNIVHATRMIHACFILHNFCLLEGDIWQEEANQPIPEEDQVYVINAADQLPADERSGLRRRQELANHVGTLRD